MKTALIGFVGAKNLQLESWEDPCKELHLLGQVFKVSSLYQIEPEENNERSQSQTACCMALNTTLDIFEFSKSLKTLSSKYRHCLNSTFLIYEDSHVMTPEVTVPHMEFHKKPQWVIPSAEIFPDWIHPVLGESFRDLSQTFKNRNWGRFKAQGKTLLDFCNRDE